MDYLKILHENPDLADEFDSLFDFFLLADWFLAISIIRGRLSLFQYPQGINIKNDVSILTMNFRISMLET